MSKLSLSSRILNQLKKSPTRETFRALQYLRGSEMASPPQGSEGSLYTLMVNQVSDLLGLMKDFKELEPFCQRFAEALDEYWPGHPPQSPLSQTFLYCQLYFDQPIGTTPETLGQVCLKLAQAFHWHPQRLALLDALCQSALGLYRHRGHGGDHCKLQDLLSGREILVRNFSHYQGQPDDLLLARVLPSPQGQEVAEIITTPYLLQSSLQDWQRYLERHPEVEHFKRPSSWNYWLEFVFEGYSGHRDDAIFLLGLPDQAKSPHHPPELRIAAAPNTYSLAQRWSPTVVQESRSEPPCRPHILLLVDEHQGTVCKFDHKSEPWSPNEVKNWLKQHSLPPKGSELWLEDPSLQAVLSEHLLKVTCRARPELPALENAVQCLTEQMQPDEPSVVACLGKEAAREFFRSAQLFFRLRPWERLDSETVLAYGDAQRKDWGVIVMGSGGQEFGLLLYSSPEDALAVTKGRQLPPVLGLSASPAFLVAANDLNLIQREQLTLPGPQLPAGEHFPSIYLPARNQLSRSQLEDLEWLLQQVPLFVRDGKAVVEEVRCLRPVITSLNERQESYALELMRTWGKDTELAWQLGHLLAEFAFAKLTGFSGTQLEERVKALVHIGHLYLQDHPRKRKLNLDYFRQLSLPKCQRLPALAATAKLLSNYVRQEVLAFGRLRES